MIHVCFGLHDGDGKYSKFVGATMASIFDNTTADVTIHILHDDTLTDGNREKFSWLVGRYNQRVEFHNVDKLCADEIASLREKLADKIKLRFSIGAFYRLLIKKIFGNGRMIYLDADIVVNLDIAELWRVDMKKFPVAAVPEIDATHNRMITDKFLLNIEAVGTEDYFCSGVMLFNIDALTENFFATGVNFLSTYPQCESPDQDALNAFFSKNYLKLEQKFDSFVGICSDLKLPVGKKIYHYAGRRFGLNMNNPFDRLWLENFSRTPWFNVEIFDGLGEEIRDASDELVRQMQWLMNFTNDKSRTFFVDKKSISVIAQIFGRRADDKFIATDRVSDELIPAAFGTLVKQMHVQRGQTIFFLIDLNYSYLRAELMQRGFAEYLDFVDGLSFLTCRQSGRVRDEFNFIRAL